MEEALMIPPAPTPNLQTYRKPYLIMRGRTSFLYTRSLDSIRYLHRITSENKKIVFVLEDETERGLDYDKGNPTEGGQSQ